MRKAKNNKKKDKSAPKKKDSKKRKSEDAPEELERLLSWDATDFEK